MSANAAHFDDNQVPTTMGAIGTLGTADTAGTALSLPISVNPATGAMYVDDLSAFNGTSYGTLGTTGVAVWGTLAAAAGAGTLQKVQ